MTVAQADTISHRSEIEQSAQRILDGWTKSAAPPPPAPSQAASRPTIDLSTEWGAMRVQMKLRSLKFYSGPLDGSWGYGSKAALRAWKKSVGLPDNDEWDRKTESILME